MMESFWLNATIDTLLAIWIGGVIIYVLVEVFLPGDEDEIDG